MPVNLIVGCINLVLWAPLQKRRRRRDKTHDHLLVKVPSVQHHQMLEFWLCGVESEVGKGPSPKLCTPLVLILGIISLSASDG